MLAATVTATARATTATAPAAIPLASGAAADRLGVPYYVLFQLIRARRITPPPRDSSGRYLWFADDLERANKAIGEDRRRKRAIDREGESV
jgi:hypothetical protein